MTTTTGVPLAWTNDMAGYQCPRCSLFVCIPQRAWATCPRCLPIPVDETAELLLDFANLGLDDDERSAVVEALDILLNATAAPPTPTPRTTPDTTTNGDAS